MSNTLGKSYIFLSKTIFLYPAVASAPLLCPAASHCIWSSQSLFIACSYRYTSFPVHFADHLDDDANSFRACFNVSLNVARSILCLSARKSYDFEPQLWLVRNRGSRETFSQQSVLFHFISKGNWSCSFWDFKLQPPFVFSSLARHLRCNFNRPTNVIC